MVPVAADGSFLFFNHYYFLFITLAMFRWLQSPGFTFAWRLLCHLRWQQGMLCWNALPGHYLSSFNVLIKKEIPVKYYWYNIKLPTCLL